MIERFTTMSPRLVHPPRLAFRPTVGEPEEFLRASRANAHSDNKDEAALPAHRPAVGLCATEGLRARPPPDPQRWWVTFLSGARRDISNRRRHNFNPTRPILSGATTIVQVGQ